MPTPERIVKLRSAVIALLGEKVSARQYLQTLGLMASCIEIIPNARLQMRPIQLHLLYWWKPVSRDLEMIIPKSHHLREHLSWWLQEANIVKGRSLSQIQASKIIATDASTQMWGGNLDHQIIQGFWSEEQKELHINCLELEAVILTIKNFLPQLRNQCVLVRSNNTTVIQYICRQGGTRSPQLCYKTWDLWQLAIKNNIILKAAHIAGKLNILPRPVEQNSDTAHRVDLERYSVEEIFSDLGSSNNRSLCIVSQQEDGHLLHLGPSSPGVRCRCAFGDMESNVCVCIPTNLPDSQSFGTHEAGTLSGNFDSSSMAKKTLVSGSTAVVHCKSNQVTSNTLSLESTKHDYISSGSQGVQSECMVAINRQLSANGFSQKVRNLLSASWRAGTQKDYSGKFKQFSSWCRGKQIDTYSASLTDCAEFLSFLFHKGLQYRTIAGYRSMLSSVLQPVNNIPVGQHPHIVRLIKGIFNSRPPTTKLLPEWELPLVLDLLKRPPFEPLSLAPLKYLTWKSLFLVAITTFRRASDIQALKLGSWNISIQKRGITFI